MSIKKKYMILSAISVLIMLILPLATAAVIGGKKGLDACLVLFLTVDPIYCIIIGFAAGKNIRHLWSLPAFSALLFLPAEWITFYRVYKFFDTEAVEGNISFAAFLLFLGIGAMLLAKLIRGEARR